MGEGPNIKKAPKFMEATIRLAIYPIIHPLECNQPISY